MSLLELVDNVYFDRTSMKTYQNATTACEDTSSVPATTVLVSGLQATDNTGECLAKHALVKMHLIERQNLIEMKISL